MKNITRKAYGKVNLFLSVGGLRADGKHEVETVLHKTSFYDTVTVSEAPVSGITVICDDPTLSCGEDNLVYRACREYERASGKTLSVAVDIKKRIPVAGGMGGGSSDCAATLLALNELYGLLSFEALLRIAASLGSDIPFFLYEDRAMLGRGTGEIMTPCASVNKEMYGVFTVAGQKQSTGAMYAMLDARKSEMNLSGCVSSSEKIINALENGNVKEIVKGMQNDFEICYPELWKTKDAFALLGAEKTFLCGSGPTVCGIFFEKEKAENAASGLGVKTFLAKIN